jgi:hypothetical protein
MVRRLFAVALVLLLGGCGAQAHGAPSARFSAPPAINDDSSDPPVGLLAPGDDASPSSSPSPSHSTKPKPSAKPSPKPSSPTPVLDTIVVAGQTTSYTFTVAHGGTAAVGTGGRLLRYKVAVQKGLPESPADVAATVDRVLDNQTRGWLHGGTFRFQRVFAGTADFIVELASPSATEDICHKYGLEVQSRVSCRGQRNVVLNQARWERGTNGTTEGATVYPPADYRILVINHEVGHALGHAHVPCPGAGAPAPVMLPSYFGLDGCAQNLWPYGADGAYVG